MKDSQESSLQDRVGNYLSDMTLRNNTFVASAEAAEAAQIAAAAEEAEMDEYLLRRAEQELESAQQKVDALRQKIEAAYGSSTSQEPG